MWQCQVCARLVRTPIVIIDGDHKSTECPTCGPSGDMMFRGSIEKEEAWWETWDLTNTDAYTRKIEKQQRFLKMYGAGDQIRELLRWEDTKTGRFSGSFPNITEGPRTMEEQEDLQTRCMEREPFFPEPHRFPLNDEQKAMVEEAAKLFGDRSKEMKPITIGGRGANKVNILVVGGHRMGPEDLARLAHVVDSIGHVWTVTVCGDEIDLTQAVNLKAMDYSHLERKVMAAFPEMPDVHDMLEELKTSTPGQFERLFQCRPDFVDLEDIPAPTAAKANHLHDPDLKKKEKFERRRAAFNRGKGKGRYHR